MSVLRGDFLGFTFNGVHSSDLGIMRVSNGDRYETNLSPTFSDRTAHVSGSDETYYFGTDCTSTTHKIDIAFDEISEKQIRRIKQVFLPNKVGKLIYDEAPYKYYMAKINSVPVFKYLCFDNEIGQRIYKGEGTIELISYYPYAKSRYKYLEDYQVSSSNITNPYINIPEWSNGESNLDEWLDSSGIISKYYTIGGSSITLDLVDSNNLGKIYLYNPGDCKTPVDITIEVYNNSSFSFSLYDTILLKNILVLNNGNDFDKKDNDKYIKIKTREGVIVGLDADKKETGNLYNEYLTLSETAPTGLILDVINSPKCYEVHVSSNGYTSYEFNYDYIYY